MTDADDIPGSVADWEDPVVGYAEMVDQVQRLGFVVAREVGDETVFVEVDRDPLFPRQA
jgi:hypothetical protein